MSNVVPITPRVGFSTELQYRLNIFRAYWLDGVNRDYFLSRIAAELMLERRRSTPFFPVYIPDNYEELVMKIGRKAGAAKDFDDFVSLAKDELIELLK